MLTEAFATPSATSATPSLSKSQNTLPESLDSLLALRLRATVSPAETSPIVVSSIIKRTPWFSTSYEVLHEPGTTIAEVLPDSFVIGIWTVPIPSFESRISFNPCEPLTFRSSVIVRLTHAISVNSIVLVTASSPADTSTAIRAPRTEPSPGS